MEFLYVAFMLASVPLAASDFQGDALKALKASLKASPSQLTDWFPNQVTPCTWGSVKCENDLVVSLSLSSMNFPGTISPQIGVLKTLTNLVLRGNNITGDIPKELGNLTRLTNLDLDNNQLTGEIPASLGNLTNLQFFDLASNNLSGRVPDRLFQVATYNFTGNNLTCGPNFHPCASAASAPGASHKSKVGIIFGSIGGGIALLSGGVLFLIWKCRNKGYWRDVFEDVAGEDDHRIKFGQLKRFAWRELQLATDNFSEENVLGQGGFGKVYKGVLADDTKIAVKRLINCESPGGEMAFLSEVEMISVAVHRNLLKLIGFCATQSERLLVYPFMQNLSVAHRLRGLSLLPTGNPWNHLYHKTTFTSLHCIYSFLLLCYLCCCLFCKSGNCCWCLLYLEICNNPFRSPSYLQPSSLVISSSYTLVIY